MSEGLAPGAPVLALCGAEACLQILLLRGDDTLFYRRRTGGARFMEHLAPDMAEALCAAGLEASELGGLACVRGPGSFTGLRVILATALGLACAAQIPLAGLNYLSLLADGAFGAAGEELCVITHSRRNEVFLQFFAKSAGDGLPLALSDPSCLSLEQAAKILASRAGQCLAVCGSGLRRNFEVLSQAAGASALLAPEFDTPSQAALTRASLFASYADLPLEPLYLRPSDAEINLAVAASGAIF